MCVRGLFRGVEGEAFRVRETYRGYRTCRQKLSLRKFNIDNYERVPLVAPRHTTNSRATNTTVTHTHGYTHALLHYVLRADPSGVLAAREARKGESRDGNGARLAS